MSSYLRKVQREREKVFVDEFKRTAGISSMQLAIYAKMAHGSSSLKNKVNIAMDAQIQALEEKYKADNPVEVIEDAEIVESVITNG